MEHKTDFELLAEAKYFNHNALAMIYDRYSTALYQYAYRQTGSQRIAEDCVAETFSRFLHALKRNKGPRKALRPYLYRIAHNWITDQYRKPSTENGLDENLEIIKDDKPGTESQIIEHETAARLREHLQKLKPDQRQVMVLKHLDGMSNAEVAEIMERNVGSVKALNSRALNNLRKFIQQDEQDQP
ncbi:MAG: sigma-70 family RNA polymerase sigma factor [Anaerolineales bacterium]|nr:sigma-70 family RNA polymerase sigma factor [Anaerolineales bacterium]